MKKSALLFTSLFALTSILTACQPSDSKITDPRVNNVRTNNRNAAPSQGAPSGFALAAYAVEKEVEAIEIARLALGVDDVANSGFKVDEANEMGVVELIRSNALLYEGNFGHYSTALGKKLTVEAHSETEKSNLLVKVSGVDTLRQYTSNVKKNDMIQTAEKDYSLTVEGLDAATLLVTLVTEVGINQKNEKFPSNSKWYVQNLSIKLTVDRESFRSDVVKILKVDTNVSWKLNSGKIASIDIKGENHEVKVTDHCFSLTGESNISLNDGKLKKVLSYTDSAAVVKESKYKSISVSCKYRPTVDLTRLMVY